MSVIAPFRLERYFARHEFSVPHQLSCSDCEPLAMGELVEGADAECRRLWDELRLAYTDSAGLPLLREEIAGMYGGVEAEDLLVLAPEEGIFVAMQVLLEAGDRVVVTRPGYQSLYEVARSLGCAVDAWLPREEEGKTPGWRFHVEDLEALLRPGTKLVVANFPHNPTGALPGHDAFRRIVEICHEAGARLFCDEMYRHLEHDPAHRLPAAVEADPRAVSLSGMSKSFSLPGLRIGWLASRDRAFMDAVRTYRDYTTICSSAPSEILALMGLRARDRIVAENRRRVETNLAALDGFMARHGALFRPRPPRAGSVCFPRLDAPEGAKAWAESLIEAAGCLVLPSWCFDAGDGHVRFGLGRKDLPENLHRVEEALARMG